MHINLENYFKDNLKKYSFKKSKKYRTWFKIKESTVFVINLQKSKFNDNFYFNIGISYIELEQLPSWNISNPIWNYALTSARAESYTKESHEIDKTKCSEFIYLMSAGGVPNDGSEKVFSDIFNYIMNFFTKNSTKEKFKQNYEKYHLLDNISIKLSLKDYCEN